LPEFSKRLTSFVRSKRPLLEKGVPPKVRWLYYIGGRYIYIEAAP
jgi:hypothetical protein